MEFEHGAAPGPRSPHAVYDRGTDPDPLYTLANERTYLAWLRLAVTLLAGAVAVDRLFFQHPGDSSKVLAMALVVMTVGVCALGVSRWWTSELALRQRRPLPGFGGPLLVVIATLLVAGGVVVLLVTGD